MVAAFVFVVVVGVVVALGLGPCQAGAYFDYYFVIYLGPLD